VTASVSAVMEDIQEVKEWCKAAIHHIGAQRGTSETLLWILMLEEVEKQLELLKHETHSDISD